MNREEHLMKTFPLEDGTTYIQNLDKSFRYCQSQIEDNGKCKEQCEHCKEYYAPLENEPKGAGAGGEVEKGNFIDSASLELGESLELRESLELGESVEQSDVDSSGDKLNKIYEKLDRDYMYNWIRNHKNRK
jgi:hypothetical protein